MKSPTTTHTKIGRNDPCFCNSGKKYKACCLNNPPINPQPQYSAEAALKLAWQAVAQQNMDATLHWFQKVLDMQPHNPQALAGLGQALCWQQKRRIGLSYLQKAAQHLLNNKQFNRDLRFILELAEQLHHWGDLETALKLTTAALTIKPANAAALNNHALYLSRLNRFKEAFDFASKACGLSPAMPAYQNMLAIIEAHLNRLPEAKQRFQRVIALSNDQQQIARAWQALVNVLDKLQEYDQAFAACLQAKACYRQLPEMQQHDGMQVLTAIQTNQQGFDASLLNRWPLSDFADTLPVPVFLLGFLRSGTTLTEQVLAAHPKVMSSDENDLIQGVIEALQQLTGCGANIPAGLKQLNLEGARQLRRHYWQRVQEEYGPEALLACFIDKVALNSIDIGLISCLFPEARIIFALRDPRDVCLSCFQQAFTPSLVTANLMTWEGIAKQYAAVMNLWLSLKTSIQPSFLELRYEDTVYDFENTFRQVFTLLNLEWSEDISQFHENAKLRYIATPSFSNVATPLYTRAVGRWQNYARYFDSVLPILNPYIAAFGYHAIETDLSN